MIMDGVYIHHLTKELKTLLVNKRINKLSVIDNYSFLLSIQGKLELYFSLNPDICHIRINTLELVPSTKTFPLSMSLKKHLESSLIKSIDQYENDRVITISLESQDNLGYINNVFLILEFFGRNANLFLVDENFIIIDCLKRSFVLEDNNQRILVPKMTYVYPTSNKINPFLTDKIIEPNNYQGVSNLVYSEIIYQNDLSIINKNINPQIIKNDKNTYFSCINLIHLPKEVINYPTLSKTLEEYYYARQTTTLQNFEQKLIENFLKKEITKVKHKIEKQKRENEKAKNNLNLKHIGDLLSANLYNVKKNDTKIIVNDFYDNKEITIELNPLINPSKNLENIYNRYKKAKRAVNATYDQIKSSYAELEYLHTIENQLGIAKNHELSEIIEELNLIKKTTKPKKKQKPKLELFEDNKGNQIWVGKNNIQNNYLTHEFAQKSDYFFHVKSAPGSHTILRTKSLDNEVIELAAIIAAYYSKSKYSSNVAVDYTKVSSLKKVPKTKGSFVTYKDYKTVYVTPSIELIKKKTI